HAVEPRMGELDGAARRNRVAPPGTVAEQREIAFMRVSIFGLGYVGAVSLACLARDGHEVIGVDVDHAKLAMLREGITPVVEEGMVDLVRDVAHTGRVTVTDDARAA